MTRTAHVVDLGTVEYREAWELQRAVAAEVAVGDRPDTVLFLEHPPTVTLGRRADPAELHIPEGADVDVVGTDRGGKSTYHGPGQLVCYPILDLTRHGQDVKRYCRDLEEALVRTLGIFGLDGTRIAGLTGVWLEPPPRKIASIGIHLTKWISTHGYALNVDVDPAPFTEWITACGLDGYQFTSMARELGRNLGVADVRPAAAQAFADVFGVRLERIDAADLRVSEAAAGGTRVPMADTDTRQKDPDDWVTGDEPMTGPQESYLETLAREAGEHVPVDLSKADASKKIDELQQTTGRGT